MSNSAKPQLDLSDSEEDESEGIKVNTSYADSYNRFREKEILQKLKDRYKGREEEDDDASSSSSSEEEEEDNPEFDKEFFTTLSLLKEKNSKIYDGSTTFFTDVKPKLKPKAQKKTLTLRDLERNVMLKNKGKFEELSSSIEPPSLEQKGYYEELDDIKSSFKAVGDGGEESDDDLLQAKRKTPQETKKEEGDYKLWLAGQKESLKSSEEAQDLKGLKDFWSRGDLDPNEKFLRDYILKEKYKEEAGESSEEEEEKAPHRVHDSDENLSEDEKTVEQMEEFETKFNFRFEEPDPEFIKRYPRTIEGSMRKKDESRKRQREEAKVRKEKERNKKVEELKQLKSLKKKEIMEKIKKIQSVAGSEEVGFSQEDLEEDFDPASYDKRMEEIFKNYDENVVDDEKPVFPDLEDSDIENELEVDNWDEWTPGEEGEDGNIMEEEQSEEEDSSKKETFQQEVLNTLGKRKGKRKSKFAQVIERKKPLFNPQENETFEKYLEEYYKLDFEDVIGDMPCRFKYRSVPKNSFGLEVEEILSAPDRELNAWSSLKKTCQYRDERDEKSDINSYKSKANNYMLKQKILPSLFASNPEEELETERLKKSLKSKRNRKTDETPSSEQMPSEKTNLEPSTSQSLQSTSSDKPSKSSRKRKRNKNFDKNTGTVSKKININAEIQMSDKRLEAYGLAPGNFKRKIRQKKFKSKS